MNEEMLLLFQRIDRLHRLLLGQPLDCEADPRELADVVDDLYDQAKLLATSVEDAKKALAWV